MEQKTAEVIKAEKGLDFFGHRIHPLGAQVELLHHWRAVAFGNDVVDPIALP